MERDNATRCGRAGACMEIRGDTCHHACEGAVAVCGCVHACFVCVCACMKELCVCATYVHMQA